MAVGQTLLADSETLDSLAIVSGEQWMSRAISSMSEEVLQQEQNRPPKGRVKENILKRNEYCTLEDWIPMVIFILS